MPTDTDEGEGISSSLEGEIQVGTTALLESMLRAYAVPCVAEPIHDEEWVAYLSGTLPRTQSERLTRRVTTDVTLRQHLREVFRTLEAVRAQPLTVEATEATSPIAHAWRAQLAWRVTGFADAARQTMRAGWQTLREEAQEGGVHASLLWETFLADVGRAQSSSSTGSMLAVVRSGATLPGITVVNAEGSHARVRRATVSREGTVSLTVVWEGEIPEGATIYLGMRGTLAGWVLGATTCEQGVSVWNLPQLGIALTLPAGDLVLDGFYLCVSTFVDMPSTKVVLLPALIQRGDGVRVADVLMEAHALSVVEGTFHLTLIVSEEIRRRYSEAVVSLHLRLGTSGGQHLGAWPLAEWEEDARELTVPLVTPDVPPEVLAALLVATLSLT